MSLDYQVVISESCQLQMQERGIKEEDVKSVIEHAELTKSKMMNEEGVTIGKKRLGEFTVYVEYMMRDAQFVVSSTYGHRVQLGSDEE